jgi:hypothetical protein
MDWEGLIVIVACAMILLALDFSDVRNKKRLHLVCLVRYRDCPFAQKNRFSAYAHSYESAIHKK